MKTQIYDNNTSNNRTEYEKRILLSFSKNLNSTFRFGFVYFKRIVFDSDYANILLIERGNDEKVIGGLTFKTIPEKRVVSLEYLYIEKLYQRRGLGRHLVNQLEKQIKRQNRKIEAIMLRSSNDSVNFYTKCGYVTDQSLLSVTESKELLGWCYEGTLMAFNL